MLNILKSKSELKNQEQLNEDKEESSLTDKIINFIDFVLIMPLVENLLNTINKVNKPFNINDIGKKMLLRQMKREAFLTSNEDFLFITSLMIAFIYALIIGVVLWMLIMFLFILLNIVAIIIQSIGNAISSML